MAWIHICWNTQPALGWEAFALDGVAPCNNCGRAGWRSFSFLAYDNWHTAYLWQNVRLGCKCRSNPFISLFHIQESLTADSAEAKEGISPVCMAYCIGWMHYTERSFLLRQHCQRQVTGLDTLKTWTKTTTLCSHVNCQAVLRPVVLNLAEPRISWTGLVLSHDF